MKTTQRPRLFLCDIDGVMTDGGRYLSEKGEEMKKFHIPDGMGMFLLKKLGIKTGIITSEDSNLVEIRAVQLSVDFLRTAAKDKLALAKEICKDAGIPLSEVAYIGDDVNDFHLLSQVGFPACPTNAQPIIKAIPGIRLLKLAGGHGAVREFINELVGEEALVEAWGL